LSACARNVLVTAAHGNQGRALIPRLVRDGHRVRAVRRNGDVGQLRELGAHEVLVGDFLDPEVRARAIEGIDVVYHVGPTAHPREAEMGIAAIDSSVAAGVKHFVYASVLHARISALLQHREKALVEEHLVGSGLPFTILQPADFMETLNIGPALDSGVFRLIWSLERAQVLVSVADVAEVAAKVITTPGHHCAATYELCAPGSFSAFDIANSIAVVAERAIATERLDVAEVERFYQHEDVDDEEDGQYRQRFFEALLSWYGEHDFLGNPNVLRMLLEREPATLEDFVRQKAAARLARVGTVV
jgi:uncharacterized protein YbjT (DUF2867 family)